MQGDPGDTATDCVERLAAEMADLGYDPKETAAVCEIAAATLRALAAERDMQYVRAEADFERARVAIARAEAAEAAYAEAARLAAEKADQLGEMRAERDALLAVARAAKHYADEFSGRSQMVEALDSLPPGTLDQSDD